MQDLIREYWWYVNNHIGEYGDFFKHRERDGEPPVDNKTKIKLIKKCMGIFYSLFEENDLGEYTFYAGQYNELLAAEYVKIGETDNALDCFEKAVDGWIAYNNLSERYEHKSILMDRLVYDKSKEFQGGDYPYPQRYIDDIDKMSEYDIIRNNPRFIAAYDKLTKIRN
jgi:tetratricopeptide (TPR) repeat protein